MSEFKVIYKIKKHIKNIAAIVIGSPFVILVLMFFFILYLAQIIVWSSERCLDLLTGKDVE